MEGRQASPPFCLLPVHPREIHAQPKQGKPVSDHGADQPHGFLLQVPKRATLASSLPPRLAGPSRSTAAAGAGPASG